MLDNEERLTSWTMHITSNLSHLDPTTLTLTDISLSLQWHNLRDTLVNRYTLRRSNPVQMSLWPLQPLVPRRQTCFRAAFLSDRRLPALYWKHCSFLL